MFLIGGQNDLLVKKDNNNKQTNKKKHFIQERPCVDYWLTLTALLPTWPSQWFVSGMAELLSGRRAYVTGAADNTWVLSWGLGEWPGSLRETERSPQPTASALGGLRGSVHCWDWGSLFCYPLHHGGNIFTLLRNGCSHFHEIAYSHEITLSTATVFCCWWGGDV